MNKQTSYAGTKYKCKNQYNYESDNMFSIHLHDVRKFDFMDAYIYVF